MTRPPLRTRALPVFPVEPPLPGAGSVAHVASFAPAPAGRGRAVAGRGPRGSAPPAGPRIGLVTLGCDKNTVDSERIMATLVGHGATVTNGAEGADVVVINTCGFIDMAKDESIRTILDACALKESGDLRAVVAVGCLVQRYRDELEQEIPEVDLFLGLTEMPGLVPELRNRGLLPEEPPVPLMERPLRILSTDTPHATYLKISEGCDHTCAFCAIPHMRGLHRSAPLPELVAEARALGDAGVLELNLISQDTTWYGRDLRRQDPSAPLLPDLLRALLDGTDIPWFRLFYMYPSGITREMVDLLAGNPRLLPYLDMPIQHGADAVLARMRRPERQRTIRERAGWLRDAVPGLVLRTTVITGFPGEREEDVEEMLAFLEEMRFDRVGVFAWSPEEGTPAAEMPDPVPEEERLERLERVSELARALSFEANEALVGTRQRVLVDRRTEPDEDPEFAAQARTRAQALEVDGVVNLLPDPRIRPGTFLEVEIVDALDYDLVAEVRAEVAT